MRLDKIPIPDQLIPIIKDYIKSALRIQPSDLLCWSCLYFNNCADSEFHTILKQHKKPPPVLPIVCESHLTPMLIETLVAKYTNKSGYIAVQDLRRYWTGHLLNIVHLNNLLNIVSYRPYAFIDKTLFVTLTAAHVSPNLKATLYTICSILYEDKMVKVDEFVNIYTYLAMLDMGSKCTSVTSTESFQDSDYSLHYPHYEHYTIIPYRSSSESSLNSILNCSLSSVSCPGDESQLMVWRNRSCESVKKNLPPRRVASDFGTTSRDGLMMWSLDGGCCEGYVGMLELIEREVEPLEKFLEQHILNLLDDELDDIAAQPERNRQERVKNVEIAKHDFRNKVRDAKFAAYRNAYMSNERDSHREELRRMRDTFEEMKVIDQELKALKEMLMIDQLPFKRVGGPTPEVEPEDVIKDSVRKKLESILKNTMKSAEKLMEYQENLPIMKRAQALMRIVDAMLGIPEDNSCCKKCNSRCLKSCAGDIDNFLTGKDQPCEPEDEIIVANKPNFRKRAGCTSTCARPISPQVTFRPSPAAESHYNLYPDLALSPGLRYCVPGIGPTVPRHVIDDVISYFKCKAKDQCGMIRRYNLTDGLCPMVQ